jgi:hypothetical protein
MTFRITRNLSPKPKRQKLPKAIGLDIPNSKLGNRTIRLAEFRSARGEELCHKTRTGISLLTNGECKIAWMTFWNNVSLSLRGKGNRHFRRRQIFKRMEALVSAKASVEY